MTKNDLKDYEKEVAQWEDEIRGVYAKIMSSIPIGLRGMVDAIFDREEQLISKATSPDNLVVEKLQLGSVYKDSANKTRKERDFFKELARYKP